MVWQKKWAVPFFLFLFFVTSAQADYLTGLVGYWPFEEGSGSTTADSVNGNTGTLDTNVDWVAGTKGNYAIWHRTAGHDVTIADSVPLRPASVSVSLWFKGNPPGTFKYLISKYLSGGGAGDHPSYGLTTSDTSGGGLKFIVDTGGSAGNFAQSPDAGNGIWDDSWHHAVGTFDGSTVRLYIDAVQVSTGTASATSITYTADNLYIGGYDGTILGPSSIAVDDVRVYNTALTQQQITWIYSGGGAGATLYNTTLYNATIR